MFNFCAYSGSTIVREGEGGTTGAIIERDLFRERGYRSNRKVYFFLELLVTLLLRVEKDQSDPPEPVEVEVLVLTGHGDVGHMELEMEDDMVMLSTLFLLRFDIVDE